MKHLTDLTFHNRFHALGSHFYSECPPQGLENPTLVCSSPAVLQCVGLHPDEANDGFIPASVQRQCPAARYATTGARLRRTSVRQLQPVSGRWSRRIAGGSGNAHGHSGHLPERRRAKRPTPALLTDVPAYANACTNSTPPHNSLPWTCRQRVACA